MTPEENHPGLPHRLLAASINSVGSARRAANIPTNESGAITASTTLGRSRRTNGTQTAVAAAATLGRIHVGG